MRTVVAVAGPWSDRGALGPALAEATAGRWVLAGPLLLEAATGRSFEVDRDERAVRLAGEGGSPPAARALQRAAVACLDAGGVAVRVETSGRIHPAADWRTLAASDDPVALYEAFVALVGDGGQVRSQGMTDLGGRDAIAAAGPEAARLVRTFLLFALCQEPLLRPGQTLDLTLDLPPCRLSIETPGGLWRLTAIER